MGETRSRPILFNGDMVRAVLNGTKTQTRRPITEKRPGNPFGGPGDELWVRETCKIFWHHAPDDYPEIHYAADGAVMSHDGISVSGYLRESEYSGPWSPSIHMPRWASRITLVVKRVWVERLHDVLELDAVSEGLHRAPTLFGDTYGASADSLFSPNPLRALEELWDSLYAARGLGWSSNPEVWCCEFEKK